MENNEEVNDIIDGIVSQRLNESSRERRAINALQGKNKRVKTFAILTAENPMGDKTDPAENKALRERLIKTLNAGKYFWYKVKGKYGNYENSIMIFNITEEAAVQLGREYRQHGIIWCEKKGDGEMEYHLWERPDDKRLVKVETKTVYEDLTDADDFYTKISKNFKFSIPFDYYMEEEENEELDRYICESVDPNKVGSFHFSRRCAIKKILERMGGGLITENSRSQKLVRAISKGYSGHIKNFGIVSPENPMGIEATSDYNNEKVRNLKNSLKDGRKEFQKELNNGHYNYLRVKGLYKNPERSYLIYNCTRKEIEAFAKEYEQQAYVWAEIQDGTVHSEMWSREDKDDEYTLEVKRDYVIDAASDKDFFTDIAKKLKFRLPFYDEASKEEWEKNRDKVSEEEEALLIKSIDPKRTGHSRYCYRSRFNNSFYEKKNWTS